MTCSPEMEVLHYSISTWCTIQYTMEVLMGKTSSSCLWCMFVGVYCVETSMDTYALLYPLTLVYFRSYQQFYSCFLIDKNITVYVAVMNVVYIIGFYLVTACCLAT